MHGDDGVRSALRSIVIIVVVGQKFMRFEGLRGLRAGFPAAVGTGAPYNHMDQNEGDPCP